MIEDLLLLYRLELARLVLVYTIHIVESSATKEEALEKLYEVLHSDDTAFCGGNPTVPGPKTP